MPHCVRTEYSQRARYPSGARPLVFRSGVNISIIGISLDKITPRPHVFTHQHGEYPVGFGSIADIYLFEQIDRYIATASAATFNYKQVAAAIGEHNSTHHRSIAIYLAELAFDGVLLEVSPGRFKPVQRTVVATGTFVRRSNGKNSVVTDADGETIFVAERNSMHALNGDRVAISVAARVRGREPEAKVTEIIERKQQTFIGTLRVGKHMGTLVTDSKFLATDIVIPRNKLRGGRTGEKAVVRITEWPENEQIPYGEVLDVLGPTGENNTEIHAILAEYGLPYVYPAAVEKAADKIDAGITPEVVAEREDMRGVVTFTIDPRDAKDFDDALSVRRMPGGNYEVGVHIADVTHYVKPDSIIDREARERATSVYLVDRVVPMLPEHLCNGICSLRPDEDKLAFSVIFEMDDQGRVLDSRIRRTVIRSVRRFTYEEAQDVIESGSGDYADEILLLDRLAKILRKERYANGSVEFDRTEVRFEIDEKGHPVSVFFKESKDANKLIEEFMLLANKTVAAAIGRPEGKRKPKAFVYRVHDTPDPDRLSDFAKLARTFGYKVRTEGAAADINKSINRMLADVQGKGEENFLSNTGIYFTKMIGHIFDLFVFYGRTFCRSRKLLHCRRVLAFFLQFVKSGTAAAGKITRQQTVYHHVGIAAYRRCEMGVVVETETVVAYVGSRIYRLGHGAYGKRGLKPWIRIHRSQERLTLIKNRNRLKAKNRVASAANKCYVREYRPLLCRNRGPYASCASRSR